MRIAPNLLHEFIIDLSVGPNIFLTSDYNIVGASRHKLMLSGTDGGMPKCSDHRGSQGALVMESNRSLIM